jgi:hypothetical protein
MELQGKPDSEDATQPQGLYLCLAADERDQANILKRLEKW